MCLLRFATTATGSLESLNNQPLGSLRHSLRSARHPVELRIPRQLSDVPSPVCHEVQAPNGEAALFRFLFTGSSIRGSLRASRGSRSTSAATRRLPYGMQVEWKTIEAIAATKAIDLWVLFPLGIGVNRLLTRSGEIPESWRRRLDLLLGTTDWYDELYRVEPDRTLFRQNEERVVKASTETIGRYFNARLRNAFADVAPEPKVLRNSTSCPRYLLCFAVGNQNGAPTALRIANHLLKQGQ